ncbi:MULTISPECIES: Bug family tripartite tricarboxylate transporter substrate binding protein [unclassified Cupriavidus]|uniref:Bug family tripartite tricarboxylate transporter substrate binding protein n=1 Tax=unclassified Cupriavidus TaxID=2640874 RepID=UPI00313DB517
MNPFNAFIWPAWRSALGSLLLATAMQPALAEDPYPSRPITWVVPFAAGGPTDAIARNVAQRVSTVLGNTIVIENVPGAGGTVGAAKVARARPDGYTLFVGHTGTMAAAPYLFKTLKYDPAKDFVPVFRFPDTPMVLLVKNGSRFKTATELLDEARKNPGKLTFGTAGVGSSSHLAAEHLASTAKVKFTFIPYKGTGPAMSDLMGGQIDAMLDQTNVSLPQTQGGRLTALALTSRARMDMFPNVPNLTERELPGFLAFTWYGIYAPTGTPQNVVDTLSKAYTKALADAEFTGALRKQGIDVLPVDKVGPEALKSFTASEAVKWEKVIKDAGIPPQ